MDLRFFEKIIIVSIILCVGLETVTSDSVPVVHNYSQDLDVHSSFSGGTMIAIFDLAGYKQSEDQYHLPVSLPQAAVLREQKKDDKSEMEEESSFSTDYAIRMIVDRIQPLLHQRDIEHAERARQALRAARVVQEAKTAGKKGALRRKKS